MGDKKIFVFVFLICLIGFMGVVSAFSGVGSGTLASPFNITNCNQLYEMNNNLTAHYQLVNSINCYDTINWAMGQGFTPVGKNLTAGFYFNGSLNGNNHEISGLFINFGPLDNVGLFGYVHYGNISNVILTNVNISGRDYVGGLVGHFVGRINNTEVTGNVNGSSYVGGIAGTGNGIYYSHTSGYVKGKNYIGGLVGNSPGEITNSYTEGNVNGTDYVGGVIGYSNYGSENNLYSTGNVNGTNYVGGVLGYKYSYVLNNSYSTGNVSGNSSVGGIVGWTSGFNTKIINSYYTGNINGNSSVGGVVGSLYNCEIQSCYASGNIAGNSSVGGIAGLAGGLMGQSVINNSYSNSNLISIGNYAGGILGKYESESVIIEYSYAIGNVSANNYTGGLVGYSRCKINNSYSTVNVNGTNYVGGIAGYQTSNEINNSYTTGNVTGTGDYVGGVIGLLQDVTFTNLYSTGNVNGRDYVGGVIGYFTGVSRVIGNSYSHSDVNGRDYVGGVIGYLTSFMTSVDIKESYSTGNVNGNSSIGGLIGKIDGAIKVEDSYSTGNVNGTSNVGGFIGYRGYGNTINSYSIGNVTGTNNVGGFIGYKEPTGTNLQNSYWYNKSLGLNCYSGGNDNCTAVSSSSYFYNYENAPMNLTAGDGWDFNSIWDNVFNGTNYPVLQWQGIELPPISCGVLSEAGQTYTLTSNVNSTGTCFNITAQNITLDCAGNWITYSTGGAANTYGIVTNKFNSTIKNCNVLDGNWASAQTSRYGIYFNENDNSTLFNVSVNVSNSNAVNLYSSTNNNLTSLVANSKSEYGLYLESSLNNTIDNAIINSNLSYSIALSSSDANNLYNIISTTENLGYGLYLMYSSNNNLKNISSDSEVFLYWMSNNNNISNLTATSGYSNVNAVSLDWSSNNTFSNVIFTSDSGYGLRLISGSSFNNFYNMTASSNDNSAIYLSGGSNNNFTNVNAISNQIGAIYLESSNYNTLNNVQGITLSDNSFGPDGIRFEYSSNNILNNVSAISNKGIGFYITYESSFNTLSNVTVISNVTISDFFNRVFRIGIDSDSNLIINSTFISLTKNALLISVDGDNNTFYWNNFTETSEDYVYDTIGSNYYNTTINGRGEGNIWYNIMNGSVDIKGNVNSTGYPSLYFGEYGTGYPYNETTSFGKVNGNVVDYAPLTNQFEDSISPTYSSVAHSSTYAGHSVTFSIQVDDETALETNGQYIFSTNNTGTWVNDSAVNFTSTPS